MSTVVIKHFPNSFPQPHHYLPLVSCLYWQGNRQEGQGSPNGGNSLQVSDIFISLKRQEETNVIFFPSLYKFKRRFLLKFCVAIMTPGFTWTILIPRDNQCLFLVEMFVLSYANILCSYPKLCLQVGSTSWLRTYLTNQYVILRYCSSNLCKWNCFYGDLPFFKIQVNHFMAQDEPFGAKIIPKCILCVRGLVPFWVLRHSSYRLLVTI